jgi:hypothetical protein
MASKENASKQFKLNDSQKSSIRTGKGSLFRRIADHLAVKEVKSAKDADRVKRARANNKAELDTFKVSGKSIKAVNDAYKRTGKSIEVSGDALRRVKSGQNAKLDEGN